MKLKKTTIIFGLLTAAVMVMIFRFSCENADDSNDTSGFFVDIVVKYFVKSLDSRSAAEQEELIDLITHVIRKAAHFTVYTALGIFSSLTVGRRRLLSAASAGVIGFCFLYAASDEIHQYFVPGRACMFTDVLLDTCGGVVGMLLSLLLMFIIDKKRKHIT